MSDIVIKAEDIGKLYKLGEISTGTISHDLNRWWARMRGKEDPFAKIGETNDRAAKGNSEWVWALKDINFEVKQGEVLGIIGRNGAGKSTLLKILSKVTKPTAGRIKTKGRIASLLEVGTGFHPELTGRENVFLNGAILGMSKAEIKSKFDEIVDFSGVERYIDTPVKRYSSGMYVRLAFAVAAFLEPEILIIDEVLAVGDAEFQKKCLGRMKDVSVNDGRTVLFVSHNMAAVSTLCSSAILLHQGKIIGAGLAKTIIDSYILMGKSSNGELLEADIKITRANEKVKFRKLSLSGKNGVTNSFGIDEDIFFELEYELLADRSLVVPSFHLLNKYGECILASFNADSANSNKDIYYNIPLEKGCYKARCIIPKFFLNDTQYSISVFLATDNSFQDMLIAEEVLTFEVYETGDMRTDYIGPWTGQIRPRLDWKTIKIVS